MGKREAKNRKEISEHSKGRQSIVHAHGCPGGAFDLLCRLIPSHQSMDIYVNEDRAVHTYTRACMHACAMHAILSLTPKPLDQCFPFMDHIPTHLLTLVTSSDPSSIHLSVIFSGTASLRGLFIHWLYVKENTLLQVYASPAETAGKKKWCVPLLLSCLWLNKRKQLFAFSNEENIKHFYYLS